MCAFVSVCAKESANVCHHTHTIGRNVCVCVCVCPCAHLYKFIWIFALLFARDESEPKCFISFTNTIVEHGPLINIDSFLLSLIYLYIFCSYSGRDKVNQWIDSSFRTFNNNNNKRNEAIIAGRPIGWWHTSLFVVDSCLLSHTDTASQNRIYLKRRNEKKAHTALYARSVFIRIYKKQKKISVSSVVPRNGCRLNILFFFFFSHI